ncbi:unnamed protein product [Camellia sinensis]
MYIFLGKKERERGERNWRGWPQELLAMAYYAAYSKDAFPVPTRGSNGGHTIVTVPALSTNLAAIVPMHLGVPTYRIRSDGRGAKVASR